ncbi:MAG: NAD-dependent epimerase/dehydratase family protein [Candidatus Wildermuthbacteria bacterium]|nr:NAD-dependent epimerase/dehydratase family protein [Candidatus Wildermuthbacteria bacterium]
MAQKILITGGGGFIGTALARNLAAKGFEIRLFDIDYTSRDLLCKKQGNCPAVEQVRGSVLDATSVGNAAKGCDYVIHLAALLGVRRTEMKRIECLNTNILGTVNVLEACLKEGVKKILFSSSSEVYGEIDGMPVREDSRKQPISVYGVTKLAGEEYLKAYSARYGLKYAIVRFFNVYGPGQVAEFVVPRFIKRVSEDKAPVIYGDGSQIRSFCFVEDAAEGAAKALLDPMGDNQAFNIGNDTEPISMKDLAQRVVSLAGKKLEPEYVSMTESDRETEREIKRRIPCIDKARDLLKYVPQISLAQGIKMVIDTDCIIDSWFENV